VYLSLADNPKPFSIYGRFHIREDTIADETGSLIEAAEGLEKPPIKVKRDIGFALATAQNGGKHRMKPVQGFGGRACSKLSRTMMETPTELSTVRFAEAIYVLHTFKKQARIRRQNKS
jgi:phage-related protein